MTIVTQGYGDRGGSIVSQGYGSRYEAIIQILVEALGMQFETGYERDYVVLAYYIKQELINIKLLNGKQAFNEVEIGDTEKVTQVPGAYIFFAPVNINENYVGPKSTTHLFTFSIKIRMAEPKTPLGLFLDIARWHGLVYKRFIGDRGLNDQTIIGIVNTELELSPTITGPLCQHRAIGGWRPPVGGSTPQIFFDIAIEKRVR